MEQNLKSLLGDALEPYGGELVKPGVICYTIVPFIPKKLNVVEPLSYNPASAESRKYQFLSMELTQLGPYLDGTKPPHVELGVHSNEVVLAYKAKLRPVVVLTPCLTEETQGFPSHFKNCVLCAPLYTLVDEDNILNPGYNEKAIYGIVALKYRSVFPVPTHPYLKSQICSLRFDRILPARINCLSKLETKMNSKWLAYIREWIRFYATGKLVETQLPASRRKHAELLNTARTLLMEELSKRETS